jgi:hypothetical protein
MSGRYRRPREVSNLEQAVDRQMAARVALVELVFGPLDGPRRLPGRLAVEVRNAIETLEAACENVGRVRSGVDLAFEPAPPVDAAELAAVRDCIDRRARDIEEQRRARQGVPS